MIRAEDAIALPGSLQAVQKGLRAALMGSASLLPSLAPLRVILFGSARSGKSTLLKALIDPEETLVRWAGVPTSAVEFFFSEHHKVQAWTGRDRCDEWLLPPKETIDLTTLTERSKGKVTQYRIGLPAPVLRDWGMEISELPHSVSAESRQSVLQRGRPVGIYLLHARGLSDEDISFLATLPELPLAFISNLYEAELVSSRSLLELDSAPVPRPAIPHVMPLIVTRISEPSGEREALLSALITLRAMIDASRISRLGQALDRGLGELDSHGTKLATRITERSIADGEIQPLLAMGELLALERWLPKAKAAQAAIDRAAKRLSLMVPGSVAFWQRRVRQCADELVANYNTLAASRKAASTDPEEGGEFDFGGDFVTLRERTIGFFENLVSQAGNMGLLPAESASLEAIKRQITEDRVEIALMGKFSSGKSSLINALLGARSDDRAPEFLHTSVRPETSTVNRIAYADSPALLGIEWLDKGDASVELTFLSPDENPALGYRVHHQTIRAFHAWLESETVHPEDCDFDFTHTDGFTSGRTAWNRLWDDLGRQERDSGNCSYLYSKRSLGLKALPPLVPTQVRIRRFRKDPPSLERLTLAEAFARLRDPAVALRTARVHLGYPNPLLRHAAIIDTPGTDSPVPHHRSVTRSLVKENDCPILYCFLSNQAGGTEDQNNLRAALEGIAKRKDDRKFFFVIARKALLTPGQIEEVIRQVRATLKEVGLCNQAIYCVEAVQGVDDELKRLYAALEGFIIQEKKGQFVRWLDQARDVLRRVDERTQAQLEDLDRDAKSRADELKNLERKRESLVTTNAALEKEVGDFAPIRQRMLRAILDDVAEVDELLAGLETRDSFDDIGKTLEGLTDDLNETACGQIADAFQRLSNTLIGTLQPILRDETPHLSLPMRSDETWFSGAILLEAADHLSWPFYDLWGIAAQVTGGWGFQTAIKENRQRLAEHWQTARTQGLSRISARLDQAFKGAHSELEKAYQSIESRCNTLRHDQDPDVRQRWQTAQLDLRDWIKRVDSLQQVYERVSRGK